MTAARVTTTAVTWRMTLLNIMNATEWANQNPSPAFRNYLGPTGTDRRINVDSRNYSVRRMTADRLSKALSG
jgi:hypothetical protein